MFYSMKKKIIIIIIIIILLNYNKTLDNIKDLKTLC